MPKKRSVYEASAGTRTGKRDEPASDGSDEFSTVSNADVRFRPTRAVRMAV